MVCQDEHVILIVSMPLLAPDSMNPDPPSIIRTSDLALINKVESFGKMIRATVKLTAKSQPCARYPVQRL